MWLFDQEHAPLIGGLGFLLSWAGFAVTWWQLHKTRNSSEAASIAVKALKFRISELDAGTELARATSISREALRYIARSNWDYALSSLDELRFSYARIAELGDHIELSSIEKLREAASDTASASTLLSKNLERGNLPSATKLRNMLNEHIELMTRVAIQIQRRQ